MISPAKKERADAPCGFFIGIARPHAVCPRCQWTFEQHNGLQKQKGTAITDAAPVTSSPVDPHAVTAYDPGPSLFGD